MDGTAHHCLGGGARAAWRRGRLQEAQAAIDRLAEISTEFPFEVPLLRLRALVARAQGDDGGYREFADRYRAMATSFGFEGHLALAAMT